MLILFYMIHIDYYMINISNILYTVITLFTLHGLPGDFSGRYRRRRNCRFSERHVNGERPPLSTRLSNPFHQRQLISLECRIERHFNDIRYLHDHLSILIHGFKSLIILYIGYILNIYIYIYNIIILILL